MEIESPQHAPAPERFEAALENARRFFAKDADVQRAMYELAAHLEEAGIPYAIAGAMALNAYGYERVTQDVAVLLDRQGLEAFKRAYLGRGYVEKFPNSKGVRDTRNNVGIDVLLAGEFPGDGKQKPISFPAPAEVAVRSGRVMLLPLKTLIELKLASGMSAPHRLKDLADVLEIIRLRGLPAGFSEDLHPYVRAKYLELWQAAQVQDAE